MGAFLGTSRVSTSSWGLLGLSLEASSDPWVHPGGLLGVSGASWDSVGASRGPLDGLLGRVAALPGASWSLLGHSWPGRANLFDPNVSEVKKR